jgi:hypothetical protein
MRPDEQIILIPLHIGRYLLQPYGTLIVNPTRGHRVSYHESAFTRMYFFKHSFYGWWWYQSNIQGIVKGTRLAVLCKCEPDLLPLQDWEICSLSYLNREIVFYTPSGLCRYLLGLIIHLTISVVDPTRRNHLSLFALDKRFVRDIFRDDRLKIVGPFQCALDVWEESIDSIFDMRSVSCSR